MYILGIHDGHNSSACLLKDGTIIFAIQEERLTRIKNYWGAPILSIKECLQYARLSWADIDHIVFAGYQSSHKPFISKSEYMAYTRQMLKKKGFRMNMSRVYSFLCPQQVGMPERLTYYNDLPLAGYSKKSVSAVRHHLCHFATAAFGCDLYREKDLLVFTVDGFGDGENASVSVVRGDGSINKIFSIPDAKPFARLYAWVTVYLGFMHLEHEYKLMGMAPYANRQRAMEMANLFGSLFEFADGGWKYKRGTIKPEVEDCIMYEDIKNICEFKRFDDICAGLQLFSEQMIERFVAYWIKKTDIHNIALSGGFFMNVKANHIIMNMAEVEKMFIFPSCGDETNSIGAAYYKYFEITSQYPHPIKEFTLGNEVSDGDLQDIIRETCDKEEIIYEYCGDIERTIAELLHSGEIVARVKGREEFGARALGNRSILANPSKREVVPIINDMIKSRDFWMPFAASILEDDKDKYLDKYTNKYRAYYMIMTYNSRNTSEIIAGTHAKDKTVRPQIVDEKINPDYYRLLREFKRLSGIGGILNTSFNLHGHPLVHNAKDAIDVFIRSGLKYLSINNYLLKKSGC